MMMTSEPSLSNFPPSGGRTIATIWHALVGDSNFVPNNYVLNKCGTMLVLS